MSSAKCLFLAMVWLSLFRPILSNSCGFVPRHPDFEMTGELLEHSLIAVDLSDLTYVEDLVGQNRRGNLFGYDNLTVWRDFDNSDLALLATKNGVCYAAFRGTISWNIRDMLQIYSQSERVVGKCGLRRGFYNAYYAGYYNEFRAAVDDCMQTSSQLVLAGQSQGGANAIVGYLDLAEYNPIAITFGTVRAVKGDSECADFSRLYRFQNVALGMYDAWVERFARVGRHVGQALLLDAQAIAPAAYLGLNDDRTNSPTSYDLHAPSIYKDGLVSILDIACDPTIEISGWEDGHWCGHDDECDSNNCASGVCTGTLKRGEKCESYFDCESQRCRYDWHLVKVCV